jgi:transposase
MHEVSTKIGGHLVMAADDQKLRVRLVGRNGRRRYEAASKERLVTACLEPGVSVSRLALEHGVNANLLRKWIKKHTPTRSPPSSRAAFIPVQLDGTADRALSRRDSVATVDLPAACDGVRGSELKEATAFCSPAKLSVSLPNGVKLALECGDVDALTAIIGALGHVQTGR